MNKFKWERLMAKDYPTLDGWFKAWKWPVSPTMDMLPENAFIVYNKGTKTPVYVGFLYLTGTSIAWMEFIVRNPMADVKECRGGLNYLTEVIGTVAKMNGASMLFSSTINDGFAQSLKKVGFVDGDKGVNQFIKHL